MRPWWNWRGACSGVHTLRHSCHRHGASQRSQRPPERCGHHVFLAGRYRREVHPGLESECQRVDRRVSRYPRQLRVCEGRRAALKSGTDTAASSGITYTMTAIDTDVVAVQRMFDVNVFGPMRMVHHFHDMIIRAAGAILNIGSIGGIMPYLYGCELIRHLKRPNLVDCLGQSTLIPWASLVQCYKSSASALVEHTPC